MKKYATAVVPVILIALFVVYKMATFTVQVDQTAVLTRLGKPVAEYKTPGIRFKIPFVHQVVYFSKKLIEYDASPSEIITNDKKNLVIDNFCRWKISDPLKFYLTVKSYGEAFNRLDDIIYSEMRNELGKHTLLETVSHNRQKIMDNVTALTKLKAKEYGIEIYDVRIKRADLPVQNEKAVYARMQAERERIAKQYRSEGQEKAQVIKATTEKEKAIILANAYKEVQEIKGDTDAKVIDIYSKAYGKDPQFFEFYKSLSVYENVLTEGTQFFLSTDNNIFKVLEDGK
ncbi:HflC protein [Denitrovibrio acetiphilus DSM 12809]|uniref:Protein HflC n=1 Tax=Denitrovibrio acetiphilus (strain DSM 12809 / NBRC 114555 / N2460) TaxID=522772 RepID=D4H7H3_DENA2|nr:protease modulator HflC [Denitrovibrio acetiphilus]ADD67972.1 HflC protein [Denitrovibrio acetiphilus DSM 12809]